MQLNLKHNFNYFRLINEPFYIPLEPINVARNFTSLYPVKYFLLNSLSKRFIHKLNSEGIAYNQVFYGVLYTGRMSHKTILLALKRINE